ncbi:MAG TPA: two-component regulator propeller domain-containing protein [Vicinamibacterales bacterium]|nr:two-component regulator propeller domain-containing protein [Vicinamibacterales bacterium]
MRHCSFRQCGPIRRCAQLAAQCVCALLVAAAFAHGAEQEDLLSGYSVTTWNEGDGRPFGAVYAIVQDRRGYLWIGADAGLFRFDGSRFTTSDDINDTPLPKTGVTALCLSADGTLWVGFADDSPVRRIRDGHVEALPRAGAPASVSDLAQDPRGAVWAVGDGVLYQFDDGGWHRVRLVGGGRDARVRQVVVRRNGHILAGTWLGTFERGAQGTGFDRIASNVAWGVAEDADGRIWTTDIAHGFRRIDQPASTAHSGAGYRVMFDHERHLWIGTYGAGLWQVSVDGPADRRTVYRAGLRTGLSSDLIQAIFEDHDGNVWVGSSGGLHRLTRRRVTPLEDLGYAIAASTHADGGMWVGTTTGVIHFARYPHRWGPAEVASTRPDVRSLYDDRRGTLWIGATEGLFRLAGSTLMQVALPRRSRPQITSIAPAPGGSLWLSDGAWVFHWDGRRLVPLDVGVSSFGRITYMQLDRSGRLWIASESGGLGFVDEAGAVHLLGRDEGFHVDARGAVHAVFEDPAGDVWVGAGNGLGRIKDGRYAAIGREHGLQGGAISSVVMDGQDRLWLSVDRGLICLDRREFDNALAAPGYRVQYRMYDALDGLAGGAFGHVSSARGDDGSLWFIQGGGLTRVDPADIREDFTSLVAPVYIESVLTSSTRVLSPVRTLSLPHGIGRVQINYTAVMLSAPNKIRFRYWLAGVDSTWIEADTQRAAVYTNLSPGTYRFHVEASAEEGVWNTSKAELGVTIEPAFYQTAWFYALCVAAALGVIWGIWRFRIGLVKREFSLVLAERVRLSRELHDTLLQSLVGVVLQLEPIAKTVAAEPIVARNQINRVRRQVEAYVREARESIKNLRSPLLKARSLATALQEFGREAVGHTSATFAVAVTGTAVLPHDIESELFRIGQEAITNAVRHAGASHIDLSLDLTGEIVIMRVTDDGAGFVYDPRAVPDDHYGLITMRERTEELHGVLRITTAVGRGTVVEVSVPTEPPFRRAIPA